jgi:hypothetical protein
LCPKTKAKINTEVIKKKVRNRYTLIQMFLLDRYDANYGMGIIVLTKSQGAVATRERC